MLGCRWAERLMARNLRRPRCLTRTCPPVNAIPLSSNLTMLLTAPHCSLVGFCGDEMILQGDDQLKEGVSTRAGMFVFLLPSYVRLFDDLS